MLKEEETDEDCSKATPTAQVMLKAKGKPTTTSDRVGPDWVQMFCESKLKNY
jgi:hypothetical protein